MTEHWSSPLCEKPGDRCGRKHVPGEKHPDWVPAEAAIAAAVPAGGRDAD